MISTDDIQHLLVSGGTVVGADGDKIGKVGQLFLDARTGEPGWVTVSTGLFGRAESFVPLAEASVQGDEIVVPYDKATVKHAPRVEDSDGHLSPDEERELYRYYGFEDDDDATDDDGTDDDGTGEVATDGEATDEGARDVVDRAGVPDDGVREEDDRREDRYAAEGVPDGTATGGRHAAPTPIDAPGSVDPTHDARAVPGRSATGATAATGTPHDAGTGTPHDAGTGASHDVGTDTPTDAATGASTGAAAAPRTPVTRGARLRRFVVTEQPGTAAPAVREELPVEPAPGVGTGADGR